MSTPNPTKKERRDAARAEREAAEQASAAAAARKQRLQILGGIVVAAAVVIVAVVLIAGGGSDKKSGLGQGKTLAGVTESTQMLAGIPQSGNTLGKADAPVTMLEFADLQCPYCKEYTLNTLPQVVQNYVRDGKVKIELHLLTFLGPDSIRGAQVAKSAADQNRLFTFADLFYYNQGEEQSGYATDAFLKQLATASKLDSAKTFADPITDTKTPTDETADALATKYGVSGTPTFVVGRTGGTLSRVSGFDYASVKKALDSALAQGT